MAVPETTCKVYFIGVWNEDSFTDEVMKNIAAHAQVEKGKKIKLILNKDGIKITKSRTFQQNFVEFYPYDKMKAVTRNPRFDNCIMFIMHGREKKHKIVAVRCPNGTNSIYIVNRVSQLRENVNAGNVEFRKRENGNWTLRDRSAHNANMHLKEIFMEQQEKSANGDTTKLNGDIIHVPILDRSKEHARSGGYIKRNGAVTRGSIVVKTGDDIPTEIHTAGDQDTRDPNDLKDMMDHVKIADTLHQRNTLPSKAVVNTTSTASTDGPLLLRAPTTRTYDARIIQKPNPYHGQLSVHRRYSGDFIMPSRQDRKLSGTASVRSGSLRIVQFDNESISSAPLKTRSMRIRPFTTATPANFSTSTTIQRSIEDTYARPVIVQDDRRGSSNAYLMSRQNRPSSIHVMGGNELRVYTPRDGIDEAL